MPDKDKDFEQILHFYNAGAEINRLDRGIGKIEFERTKEIIGRYLSEKKQVIYDIGAGIGVYSKWLALKGHEVHMFELAPKAVEYAVQNESLDCVYAIEVADARSINRPDKSADIVLLMGPLYHLTAREERLMCLREAARVLKKDGLLVVSTISRYGSTLWGLSVYGTKNNVVDCDQFWQMIQQEIRTGQHIRPEKYPYLIARSYFHSPDEIKGEMEEAGFVHEKNVAVEGPVWIAPTINDKWTEEESRNRLLNIIQLVEEDEDLMGMSPHILSIARKSNL